MPWDKCCTFLHHSLVSVDWLNCIWTSRFECGSVMLWPVECEGSSTVTAASRGLCQPPWELVEVTFWMTTGMWPSDSQHPGQQPLTLRSRTMWLPGHHHGRVTEPSRDQKDPTAESSASFWQEKHAPNQRWAQFSWKGPDNHLLFVSHMPYNWLASDIYKYFLF